MTRKILGGVMFAFLMALILSSMTLVATAAEEEQPSQPAQMQEVSAKVDINTATAEQLEALPGIGPSIAGSIVKHREMQGPFKSIEDLKSVKGIGEKKFAAIQDKITVTQP